MATISGFPVVDSSSINNLHRQQLGLVQLSRSASEVSEIIASKENAGKGFWGIAKALLPPGTKDSEISAMVKHLQELNPKVKSTAIRPGQKIIVPAPAPAAGSAVSEEGKKSWLEVAMRLPHRPFESGMMTPIPQAAGSVDAGAKKIQQPWAALDAELKIVELQIAQGNSAPALLTRRDELKAEVAARAGESRATSRAHGMPLEMQWKNLMIESNLLTVRLDEMKALRPTPEVVALLGQTSARLVELAGQIRDVQLQMETVKKQVVQQPRLIGP